MGEEKKLDDSSYTVKILVTPQIAEQWLKKNPINRAYRADKAKTYAKDMENDNWEFYTNDSIVFGTDGNIRNGQHRLHAVIISGKTIGFNVLFNSNCTVFDRGRNRSIKDTMEMKAKESGDTKMLSLANGNMLAVARFHYSVRGVTSLTDSEIIDFVMRNESQLKIAYSMAWAGSSGPSKRTALMKSAPCQYALLVLLHAGIDEQTLRDFSLVVNSGYGNGKRDFPAVTLRNQLLEVRQTGFTQRKYMLGITLDAAKAYAEKKERKRKFDGENFPYLDDFISDDLVQMYRDMAEEENTSSDENVDEKGA